jgi:hypothetical protein
MLKVSLETLMRYWSFAKARLLPERRNTTL